MEMDFTAASARCSAHSAMDDPMDNSRALEIVNALASGADPFTGEIFPAESTLQHPEIVRALFRAAAALAPGNTVAKPARTRTPPPKAGMPWSEDEDRQLLAGFDAGRDEKELATLHERTPWSIRSRLAKHGRLPPVVHRAAPSASTP
jgi:hypothetical protein